MALTKKIAVPRLREQSLFTSYRPRRSLLGLQHASQRTH